jgi:hypothetical protein
MARFHTIWSSVVVLLAAEIAFSQQTPLGDVARQQRDRQKAKLTNRVSTVVTNEDLPKHSDGESDSATREDAKDEQIGDQSSAKSSRPPERQSAEQWQSKY